MRHAICGSPPPRSLSETDQRRLLAALASAEGDVAHRDHALFHLLLATGVRLGAALALDAADLDLDGGEALLRRSKGGRVRDLQSAHHGGVARLVEDHPGEAAALVLLAEIPEASVGETSGGIASSQAPKRNPREEERWVPPMPEALRDAAVAAARERVAWRVCRVSRFGWARSTFS